MRRRRYTRRLSPTERFSLVLNELYRYNVDGVLEGVGTVDPVAFQHAVDVAAEANPAIRVRLRGVLGFCKWVDSGISPTVRVMPLADWDGKSEVGAPFLKERFEPLRGGPVSDVLIVPCRDGKTRIVFRTCHAAFDGRGVLHWCSDIIRVLRGEAPVGSRSEIIDFEVQARHQDKVAPETPSAPTSCIPVLTPGDTGRRPVDYIWRRAVIRRNVSQLLPKTAVFLAEWARRQASGDVGFTIPIDFRGLRTQEMSIGNLTGYLRLPVPEGATPRAVMQTLNSRIRDYADCRQLPGMKNLLWIPIWLIAWKIRPNVDTLLYTVTPSLPSGGIVSMGGVSPEAGTFPGFAAEMMYGIPGAVGKLNVVFVNLPNMVTVQFSTPAAYNDRGQLDALVKAYEDRFSAETLAGPVAREA